MKKLKLAALLTAFTLSVTAFAACGKKDDKKDGSTDISVSWETANFQDVFKTKYVASDDEATAPALNGNVLSAYDGYECIPGFDNYEQDGTSYTYSTQNHNPVVAMYKVKDDGSTDYRFYNVALGKEILQKALAADEEFEIKTIGHEVTGGFWVYALRIDILGKESSSTEYYTFEGTKLNGSLRLVDEYDVRDDNGRLISKELVFKVSDSEGNVTSYRTNAYTGKLVKNVTEDDKSVGNEFKDFETDYEVEGENYGYKIDPDGVIAVYEKGSNKIAKLADFRGEYENVNFTILANETFLVQLNGLTDGEYDYIRVDSGKANKYKLKSYVYDPASGEKTEVKLNYLCMYAINSYAHDDYDNMLKCENVGLFYRIIDKKLDTKARIAVLKNNLEVGGVIDNYVPNQDDIPYLISDGVFEVETSGSSKYYLDATGKIIGKNLTGTSYINSTFVRTDRAIYNVKTLENIIDLSTDEYSIDIYETNFNGNVVIKKNYIDDRSSDMLLITPETNTPKKLFSEGDVFGYGFDIYGYYYVQQFDSEKGLYTVTYYNADGNEMFSFNSSYGYPDASSAYSITENTRAHFFRYIDTDANGVETKRYCRCA